MTKFHVMVEKDYDISDQFILDAIIDPAGYGINYWANLAEIDEEARTYTVRDMFGDFNAVQISFDTLAKTLIDIAYHPEEVGLDYSTEWSDWAREALWEIEHSEPHPGGSIDSELADVIVQIAAFGELMYG